MRFSEIASPEDQLALWKMVSDKMWAAFGQSANQQPSPVITRSLATSNSPKVNAKHIYRGVSKPIVKSKPNPVKTYKSKKAPTAPAPKPLPKPQPTQLTPTQATKQQTLQHQQLAQHLHKEIAKSKPRQRIYPLPAIPPQRLTAPTEPLTNSYDERDKDELVMHSLAHHPFKTIAQVKSAFSGQRHGF